MLDVTVLSTGPCLMCGGPAQFLHGGTVRHLPQHEPSGCDCCDHPLQHAIRAVIARYEAPIPPPTHAETIADLRDRLQQWEDDQ